MTEPTVSKPFSMLWRGQAICRGNTPAAPVFDLSDQPLTGLIIDLYPQLSWLGYCRLANWLQSAEEMATNIDWSMLAKHYGFNFQQKNNDFILRLADLPKEFFNWADERQLSQKDLAPLMAVEDLRKLEDLLRSLAQKNPSRSDGKAMLDWLVDLYLMNVESDKLLAAMTKEQLYALRFPQTAERDKKKLNQTWPAYCRHSQQRNGDRLIHNLAIQFNDLPDLRQKLSNLIDGIETQK